MSHDTKAEEGSRTPQFNSLKPWLKRIAVIVFFTFGMYLTYRHILVIAVLEDKGGEIGWTSHIAITLLWVLMAIVGYRLRNKALRANKGIKK